MVLWSWQLLQRLCQLPSSQNSSASPLWGMMWSTTVAFTRRPCSMHLTQRGCAFKNHFRAFSHLPSYPRTDALARSEACSLAWSVQYIPSVSLGHPGCLHGFNLSLFCRKTGDARPALSGCDLIGDMHP